MYSTGRVARAFAVGSDAGPRDAVFLRVARWAQGCEGRKGRGLVLLAVVVYTPALLFGGFVWDDWIVVTEPLVRRLDGIVSIWLSPAEIGRENHYWPIVYTTFWLEHKLWGSTPSAITPSTSRCTR